MSATDERGMESGYPHTLRPELHRALDAAGIDYWVAQGITFWNRDDGCECLAYGFKAGGVPKLAIKVVGFTDPEQAIAAMLGNGECEMVTSGTPCEGNTDKACTACGAYNIGEFYDGQSHRAVPKFCPNCGRPVKGGL